MRFPAKQINSITVPLGGKEWQVEIFEADFHYPYVARWTAEGEEEVWCVANHFLVQAASAAALEQARTTVSDLVRRSDPLLSDVELQFRYAPTGEHKFRVEPSPATFGARALAETGTMLRALSDLPASFPDGEVTTAPNVLIFLDPRSNQAEDGTGFERQKEILERIGATKAWETHSGSRRVTVAVVDTGIDYQHPDLAANIPRVDGRVIGADVEDNGLEPDDRHWHGTYLAGLVGAVGGDNFGITGVCPQCNILPIRAFSSQGVGTGNQAAQAIRRAVDLEADVILCAWGSPLPEEFGTTEVESAIKYAREKGVLVVASGGNHAGPTPHYPASFPLDNVIAVGGTDHQGIPVPEWGKRKVDVSAPGLSVYSTMPTRLDPIVPYMVNSGTSPAAALVAGACALLKSYARTMDFPDDYRTIRAALLDTIEKFGSSPGGLLRVDSALAALQPAVAPHAVPTTDQPYRQ